MLRAMGVEYWIYDAPVGCGPVNRWESMRARPLGTPGELEQRLAALFPFVRWKRTSFMGKDVRFGLGTDERTDRYIDVMLSPELEDTPAVHFVSLNKPGPSTMRLVMEALGLNRVFACEPCVLIDPYAYEDGDRQYAELDDPAEK